MAIVREWERGTLEQLIVTPVDKTSLMLGLGETDRHHQRHYRADQHQDLEQPGEGIVDEGAAESLTVPRKEEHPSSSADQHGHGKTRYRIVGAPSGKNAHHEQHHGGCCQDEFRRREYEAGGEFRRRHRPDPIAARRRSGRLPGTASHC
jgi:hypothetical protein